MKKIKSHRTYKPSSEFTDFLPSWECNDLELSYFSTTNLIPEVRFYNKKKLIRKYRKGLCFTGEPIFLKIGPLK